MNAPVPIALLVLLTADLPEQQAEPAAPRTRVVCSMPGLPKPWLVRIQAADGRFPALWRRREVGDHTADEPSVAASDRDLRVTALATLALLGDGSTLSSGPHRDAVRRAVSWLVGQRDDRGRMALGVRPDWIVDHAMATYALCEAGRLSPDLLMRERVAGPLAVLNDHLRRYEDRVDVELLVWCRMCAWSAAKFESWCNSQPEVAEPWDSGAAGLDANVSRLSSDAAVDGARARAARLLLDVLATSTRDEAARLAEPFVADGWPEDGEDPLALFYGSLACYWIGGPQWRGVEKRLTPVLVRTQRTGEELGGAWDPRGSFGADWGRVGTTAVHVLTLELYYRYSCLEVARH